MAKLQSQNPIALRTSCARWKSFGRSRPAGPRHNHFHRASVCCRNPLHGPLQLAEVIEPRTIEKPLPHAGSGTPSRRTGVLEVGNGIGNATPELRPLHLAMLACSSARERKNGRQHHRAAQSPLRAIAIMCDHLQYRVSIFPCALYRAGLRASIRKRLIGTQIGSPFGTPLPLAFRLTAEWALGWRRQCDEYQQGEFPSPFARDTCRPALDRRR